ncbi:MAG: ZIP family metal transporter [Nitrososphaerales archaeon]
MSSKPYLLAVIPIILVAALLFFVPPSLLGLFPESAVPVEDLSFERVILEPDSILIEVFNGGPSDILISQLLINDHLWGGYIEPDDTVPRFGRAKIIVPFTFVEAEPIHIMLISSNAIKFEYEIEAAVATPVIGTPQIGVLAMMGVYVGVIPVFLGLLWLPLLQRIANHWKLFFLSLTVGFLAFIGVDTILEGMENALEVSSTLQGPAILVFVTALTFLGLQYVGERGKVSQPSNEKGLMKLAYMVALGIGLHNVGEGLAIGSAYALGEVALGTFLVIGFTVHNLTEGIAIVSPISKRKVLIKDLILLGLLAGGPTIIGSIIGGFAFTALLATIFLAVAAGAVLQVVYEVGKLSLMRDKGWAQPRNLIGLLIGLLIMYVTGLIIG